MIKFSELQFKPHLLEPAWIAQTKLETGHIVSVVCGEGMYSQPNTWIEDPMQYESYELAIFDQTGAFVNLSADDDVAAYQSKEDIEQIIAQTIEKSQS